MAGLGIGLALVVPFFVGCSLLPHNRDRGPAPTAVPSKAPDASALVNYLNQNAQRVQTIRAKVAIDAKQGTQPVGLDGELACQKPRDFRLKAKLVGRPAVDIGSNNEEFWYWISQAPDPYVYHCSYADMATGKVNLPFPFHPDMVVAAMGIAEYDPEAKYEVRVHEKTVDLIQDATTASGQPVKRITVFNRYQAAPGQPQVLGHVLMDLRGKPICRATVHKIHADRGSGAIVPASVTIEWPAQELSMKLMLSDIQTNSLDKTITGRLFSRADLTMESFDIGKGRVDRPSSIRSAGALMPARR